MSSYNKTPEEIIEDISRGNLDLQKLFIDNPKLLQNFIDNPKLLQNLMLYRSSTPSSSASSPTSLKGYRSGSPSYSHSDNGGQPTFPSMYGVRSSGSSCFIATAAYGSSLSQEVKILKQIRDQYLLVNKMGKSFVSFYYKYSPKIAHHMYKHTFLKKIVRIGLHPVVKISKLLLRHKFDEPI